jgi:hypothetical protein
MKTNRGGPFKPFFGLSGLALQPKLAFMPRGLKRFQRPGQTHLATSCCYCRRESFAGSKIMEGKSRKPRCNPSKTSPVNKQRMIHRMLLDGIKG